MDRRLRKTCGFLTLCVITVMSVYLSGRKIRGEKPPFLAKGGSRPPRGPGGESSATGGNRPTARRRGPPEGNAALFAFYGRGGVPPGGGADDDDAVAAAFQRRSEGVRDACLRFGVRQNASAAEAVADAFRKFAKAEDYVEYVSADNFHLARSASTMTCLINKVASTSVAVALLQADDRPVPDWTGDLSPHNAATVLKPKTQMEFNFARKHFFKFLLVRHPFERLLSAYRDKVERANHWSLIKLRKHITNSLKEAQNETSEHSSSAPEDGGVSMNVNTEGMNESTTATALNETVPTFSDFLEYILSTNLSGGGFESHWTPYWRTCSPCSVNYNVIAKLETADQDFKFVGERMGLQWTSFPGFNRSGAGESSSQPEILERYYRNLNPALIGRVYRRFALDFHLFQYDIMDVFRQGGHCQTHKCSEMMLYL